MSRSTSNANDFRDLSEDDINLLHEIVKLADESPDTPRLRALFAAYYKTLAQHDLDPDRDQTYFRFLLRMRDGLPQKKSLVEQFAAFLGRHGIQVVFDGDEDVTDDVPSLPPQDDYLEASSTAVSGRESEIASSRRASFTSLQDIVPARGITQPNKDGLDLPARPRSQNMLLDNHRRKDPLHTTHEVSWTTALQEQIALQQARLSATRNLKAQRSVRPNVDTNENDIVRVDKDARQDPMDARSQQSQALQVLETIAKTQRFRRLARHAHGIFQDWRERAHVRMHFQIEQDEKATAHDHAILLRQAFDHWVMRSKDAQRQREIERAFEHLEYRAGKVRDLFLLTKAFTHWAQCTSDEVLRTSEARRHILKTRCFNAWRDVTVVNELKVRRQRLSKFLNIWKQKTANVLALNEEATDFQDSQLASRFYRNWFWQFCDRRAPVWYSQRLQSRYLEKWHQLARSEVLRGQWSADFAGLRLLSKFLLSWNQQLQIARQRRNEAENFWRRNRLRTAWNSWRREQRFAPNKKQLAHRLDSWTVGSVLQTWRQKTQSSLDAEIINEARIMKNAWTTWNDHLRLRALQGIINDRLKIHALYKWILAERLALYQRHSKRRLLSRCFSSWRTGTDKLGRELGRAQQWVQQTRDSRTKQRVLQDWLASTRTLLAADTKARDMDQRLAKRHVINQWAEQAKHIARLRSWAADARYFVLANRTIRKWRDAVSSNKKAKRRQAYAIVRQREKTTLARHMFEEWRNRSKTSREHLDQAQVFDQERMSRMMQQSFVSWVDRICLVDEMEQTATSFCQDQTLSKHLHLLVERLAHNQQAHERALGELTHSTEEITIRLLRKMSWRLFQMQKQRESALSLGERTQRRRQSTMFKYWVERTRQHRNQPSVFDDPNQAVFDSDAASRVDALVSDASTLRRSVLRTLPFARRPEVQVAQTPGYLRTPSRRTTGKARLRMPMAATPATNSVVSFQNRLRDAYPGGLTGSARGNFAQIPGGTGEDTAGR